MPCFQDIGFRLPSSSQSYVIFGMRVQTIIVAFFQSLTSVIVSSTSTIYLILVVLIFPNDDDNVGSKEGMGINEEKGSSDVVLRKKKLIISGFVGVGQRMTIQVELFVMIGINVILYYTR